MKRLFTPSLIVLAILLTACGSSVTNTPMNATNSDMPTATQLALGSLKLDETDNAITAEQAVDLLPMWQVYEELLNSDTAAQEEIDALTEQIQETMTSEQMQAITDMQLTQQDMITAMQGANTFTSSSQSSNNVTVPSSNGGMPTGGPPDGSNGAPSDMGGGLPSDFGGVAPDTSAGGSQNTQTGSGQARGVSGVPIPLIQMVIESLQQKIAA